MGCSVHIQMTYNTNQAIDRHSIRSMRKQQQISSNPRSFLPNHHESAHQGPTKMSSIPRYSEKFKDIMAKSQQNRKLPQLPQHQEEHKQKSREYFFFRVKSIGVGAHSFVYLVQDEQSKMLLSQKSVTKSHARQISEDLVRQIKLLFYLSHPNIVTLYHVYHTETHINMVMEFAQDSLFALKQRFGIFKEKQIIEVIRQLLQALKYIHQQGIVHADVKLENVMIANGTIKLCDFGLAHQHRPHNHQDKDKPIDGTMQYLSPEYAQGIDSGTHRDIWAVGMLVYEMSVGKHPFQGLKQNEKWSKLVKNAPESYTSQLQIHQKQHGTHSDKVLQLVKGIFLPYSSRRSAEQLLQLPFFCSSTQ